MSRILLIEDERLIAESLIRTLRGLGYEVRHAADGAAGLKLALLETPDLVILDVMLPGLSGWEVCKGIRRESVVPILMLTALNEEVDRILGLELGADDYVTKPCSVQELLARVRALFRRVDALGRTARQEAGRLEAGALSIDPVSRQVRCKGEAVELTAREFDLLFFFARHPGQVFSRMDLLAQVWGYSHEGYEHTVNTHINRLRAKLEPNPAEPRYLLTVWGVGYKFAESC